jgi:hypothetical protein
MTTPTLGRFFLVALVVHTAAPLAQTNPPQPPTNLRIVNGPVASSCPAGQIGAPPNCVPLPPAPAAGGKQWTLAFAEEHYHYNNRSSSYRVNTGAGNNGACQVRNYSTDWVRFGLDWQPTYVAWYIDGVKCGQFNGNTTTIESGPMQPIL